MYRCGWVWVLTVPYKRGLQPLVINEPHLTYVTFTNYAHGQHDVAEIACS